MSYHEADGPGTPSPDDAGEERFWEQLADYLPGGSAGTSPLGHDTLDLLDDLCAPAALSSSLKARLTRLAQQAEHDLEFAAELKRRRRHPSLGTYLAFLRGRSGATVSELAKRLRLEFQWLADLERDALSPKEISARRLADLLKRLKGSLQMAEGLLFSTIQAPPYLVSTGRDSLYRRGTAASQGIWAQPPDSGPVRENPHYQEEVEAVAELRESLRAAWSK